MVLYEFFFLFFKWSIYYYIISKVWSEHRSYQSVHAEQPLCTGLTPAASSGPLPWITKEPFAVQYETGEAPSCIIVLGCTAHRIPGALWIHDSGFLTLPCVYFLLIDYYWRTPFSPRLLFTPLHSCILQTEDPAMERPYTFKDFLLRPRRSVSGRGWWQDQHPQLLFVCADYQVKRWCVELVGFFSVHLMATPSED